MNNHKLPRGWAWTTLGEVRLDEGRSATPQREPENVFELYSVPSFDNGKPEIVSGKQIGSSKRTVEADTVLLCKINPRINRVWVVGDYSQATKIASTEWIPFFKVDEILPTYLCYYMRTDTFRDFLAMNVSGVGSSLMRVKASVLADYPFPLPPFAEQQRIVDEIEAQFTRLGAGVAALKRAQARLRRYRTAVLKAACEGKLVPQDPTDEPASVLLERILAERRRKWEAEQVAQGKDPAKLKYQEPAPPSTDNLPVLPQGWVWATAEQLCGFITKGTTPKANKLFQNEGEVPFIKVYNLTFNGHLDFTVNPTFVSQQTHSNELSRSIVLPGDVLMNICFCQSKMDPDCGRK